MYLPDHFAADDDAVEELLANHGAADLVTITEKGMLATLLPFVFDRHDGPLGALLGHVARGNEQWRRTTSGEVLVIVRGPDAYVSPSWYPSKLEHGRVVPTWNYVTAHVYGLVEWHDDVVWVEDLVRRLTAKHEGALDGGQPWTLDDAPRAFVEAQLRGIVGARVEITRVEAKVKMSQNRSDADARGVVDGLAARGDVASSAAVHRANDDRL
ncbi:MAG: FMN-binding negative transcriptional regulator [Actinomycetota bacterium]|nr:FMN-binding negative transcriptional regulator [Actinomycetota bacterium]